MAIKGMHALFYTRQSDALRDFFLKLQLPHSDVGEGWLIFDVEEGDFGVHPTDDAEFEGTHAVSFYCDDIEATVRELQGRGVTFSKPISDQGWGRVTDIEGPGGVTFQLYEPRYRKTSKKAAAKRAPAKKKTAAKKAPAKKKAAAKAKKPAAKAKKKR